jgi:hypothetical protein
MNNLDDEWSRYLTDADFVMKDDSQDKETNLETETYKSQFSDLYISTKTKVLFLNQPIDITNIFWNIPIIEYGKPECGVIKKQMKIISKDPAEYEELKLRLQKENYYTENIIKQIDNPTARRIKFKDERKITIGISRKDIINSRGKIKNAFYNCFAMILRFRYEDKFKEIHVKVFNTGKLEIPGILNTGLLDTVKAMILEILQPILSKPIVFIEHEGEEGNVLINSNFNCGFFINRDKLHAILRGDKYGIEAAYDPCSYPGVKCKFYFNNDVGVDASKQNGKILSEDRNMKMSELIENKKYTEVSFMIFRTGSGLIVGNCSDRILAHIFEFIRNILEEEYNHIHVANETVIIKDKTLKIRKRNIMITPDYYTKLQAI